VPNERRTYTQPRRINAVSVSLMLLFLAAGYFAFACWPVIALNADVKNVLEDALPLLYRANLLQEPDSTTGSEQLRQVVLEKLTAVGVPDPETALTITRDSHTVALAVKIATAIDLKVIRKKIPVALNPRVETTAERVSF
jgi:hypothetical protein